MPSSADSSKNSTGRFTAKAGAYHQHRPGYPPASIALIAETFQLSNRSVIADIGSGTGISSAPFLTIGATVLGVEPNQDMRAIAEQEFAGLANFRSVNGAAEATTLSANSVDLVLVAQALHWFDLQQARQEFRRILKKTGGVAVLWNERRSHGSPFSDDLEVLLKRYAELARYIPYQNVAASPAKKSATKINPAVLATFFDGGVQGYLSYENFQLLDFPHFVGRMASYSYLPNPENSNYPTLVADLQKLFDTYQQNGKVRIDYDTRVYWGR
ncbi:MAG: class I SAM-dependent methyltransferase [Patescibacteria group bacterium]|nr:class I SAM-dependent methyltransferase [Patescibacteria group bacterium]